MVTNSRIIGGGQVLRVPSERLGVEFCSKGASSLGRVKGLSTSSSTVGKMFAFAVRLGIGCC